MSSLPFRRSEMFRQICESRDGGDFSTFMRRLDLIERGWFDDLNCLDDYLSSQDVNSPPRLPSRRSGDPYKRYLSNWAHYQKRTRFEETEFMGVEKYREAWDRLVEAFPFAFNW